MTPSKKPKTRKTRQELEKTREINRVMKTFCWLATFCLVVSLIKIASVFALKGDNIEYVSEQALPTVRVLICAHAILALFAILSRHYIVMGLTLLLTVALFVASFSLPIYAKTIECAETPEQHCEYALEYYENNIYDF